MSLLLLVRNISFQLIDGDKYHSRYIYFIRRIVYKKKKKNTLQMEIPYIIIATKEKER